MKNNLNITVLCILLLIVGNARAQSLDCRLVESLGNNPEINAILLEQLSAQVAAAPPYKGLTKLKEIKIKEIESLRFEGCKAIAVAKVVIDRQVRKNAKGTITIRGDVVSASNLLGRTGKKSICISNAKIKDVDVSNTFRLGEKFYEWGANKVFPNNQCYEWE